MAESNVTGIVIKIFDYDDFDQIVTVLTRDEVVPFIAMGVRKLKSKNRVALQLGNLVELELFRARLAGKVSKLKRATLVQQPPIKQGDTALVLLETIKYLTKIQAGSPELFNAILESYPHLGGDDNHFVKTYIVFRILYTMGMFPIMDKCVECGRNDRIDGFEFHAGGFTCVSHTKKKRPVEFLKAIHSLDFSMEEYSKTDPIINKMIFRELTSFITENIY